jgi:hypothetical protein
MRERGREREGERERGRVRTNKQVQHDSNADRPVNTRRTIKG